MSKKITFIVPGLLDPVPYLDQLPAQEFPELPVFSTLLSRGKLSIPEPLDHGHDSYYRCLYDAIQSESDPQSNSTGNSAKQLPIASISFLYDKNNLSDSDLKEQEVLSDLNALDLKDKWIMRVDPSFMAPDRDQLVLSQTQDMDISMAEARQLVAAINEFFLAYDEEKFWTLYAISPERWYIVSEQAINIETVPPEKVLGQSVKPYLLSGEDSAHWLNLFNEFQMILHQSPINAQRMKEKKLPVNSLWFWGAGQAIDCSVLNRPGLDKKFIDPEADKVIYTDNVFAKGLAKMTGETTLKVPDKLENLSEKSQKIYIIEDFIQAIYRRDIFNWIGLLKQFEENYLESLLSEIKSGRVTQLEFISPSGTSLLINKRLLRRWWRKKVPVHVFLSADL